MTQPRISRANSVSRSPATAVVVVIVLGTIFTVIHMLFTVTYNMPIAAVKAALPQQAAGRYIEPLLVQDYKIFAPEPVHADTQLWVRAWYKAEGEVAGVSGSGASSDWVNVTAVETSSPVLKVLRKKMTILGAERMRSAYAALSAEQQRVMGQNYHRLGTDALAEDLRAAAPDGSSPGEVARAIRISDYLDGYATQVALAFWPEQGEPVAVQVRVVTVPVIRWNDRFDPDAQRPDSQVVNVGWRAPVLQPNQDSAEFARSFVGWSE